MSDKYNKNSKPASNRITFKEWVSLAIGIFAIGFWLKTCVQHTIRNNALQGETKLIRAVVINKKNFYGNSPVSHEFSYSYRFKLNGKIYEGDTRDSDLRVGDSITVRYVAARPELNEASK